MFVLIISRAVSLFRKILLNPLSDAFFLILLLSFKVKQVGKNMISGMAIGIN